MMTNPSTDVALALLQDARKLANYADDVGLHINYQSSPAAYTHLGAVLADATLQAGVNYRTVVQPRIERILAEYPRTQYLQGLVPVVAERKTSEYLMWNHREKTRRFEDIFYILSFCEISNVKDLRQWLLSPENRQTLMHINGVGQKTVDYMARLVGMDCIAVDRHIKLFVRLAGIKIDNYENIKNVVSYAADLLNVSRRDFDRWIWIKMSGTGKNVQLPLI